MQVPAQMDFQGFTPDEKLRTMIEEHVTRLEEFSGRLTACRVVMKAPGHAHRTGGLYEVNIHIALPDGREVAVERTPPQDERFSDPVFAINDAFGRARRQLQDQVREMRGDVKTHEAQPMASVRMLDRDKGFGFLETADGREVYFHRNSVLHDAFDKLEPGTRVTFVEEMGDKGPQASTVTVLGKHGLRA